MNSSNYKYFRISYMDQEFELQVYMFTVKIRAIWTHFLDTSGQTNAAMYLVSTYPPPRKCLPLTFTYPSCNQTHSNLASPDCICIPIYPLFLSSLYTLTFISPTSFLSFRFLFRISSLCDDAGFNTRHSLPPRCSLLWLRPFQP